MLYKISYMLFMTFMLIACSKNFGQKKEYGNLEVFYTKDVPIEYVDGVGSYFKTNNLILDHKHSVKLTSNANSFILKMILNPEKDSLPKNMQDDLKLFEQDIHQTVFPDLNFYIEICDANFYPLNKKH